MYVYVCVWFQGGEIIKRRDVTGGKPVSLSQLHDTGMYIKAGQCDISYRGCITQLI